MWALLWACRTAGDFALEPSEVKPCASGLVDGDWDGFAAVTPDGPARACADDPWPGDCDDADPYVHPYQQELCNQRDDDCDGLIDEGTPQWYADEDQDGHGDPEAPFPGCEIRVRSSTTADDCDDGDAAVHASAPEICD